MEHSLEKLFMIVPTFVDLNVVDCKDSLLEEVCRERNGWKRGAFSSITFLHYKSPVMESIYIQNPTSLALRGWLRIIMDCNGTIIMEDGIVPYMARHLIISTVIDIEDDDAFVYDKECQKREWLKETLESDARDDTIIKTLDADYEDIESLNNPVVNTMRCDKPVKNCTLQNVFEIFN